jgi:hypothetical protein
MMKEVVRVRCICTLSLDDEGSLEMRWMWKLKTWPEEYVVILERPDEMGELDVTIKHAGDVINESIRKG